MSNQLFRHLVDLKKFINFLKNAIILEDSNDFENKYEIRLDKTIYKKLIYHNLYHDFLKSIEENYFVSKRHYVNKSQSYNSFLTICRQICKSHKIEYKSKILYDKSKYEIIYIIYIDKKIIDKLDESI